MTNVEDKEIYRILVAGRPDFERCDNTVKTSKYSILSFLPVAVVEQFRRIANMYFLISGFIMAIGAYTTLYDTAVNHWTTLGPLAIIISVSLAQEGGADIGRHRSDAATNNYGCVVLRRADELDAEKGKREVGILNGEDVTVNQKKSYFKNEVSAVSKSNNGHNCKIAFEAIKRKDIRQGHIVLIRNKEMVPADTILLASSSDNGTAYVETSSIDGETNLKLRITPHLPKDVLNVLHRSSTRDFDVSEEKVLRETLIDATKRICRQTALGFPDATSAIENSKDGIGSPMEAQFSSFLQRSKSAVKLASSGAGYDAVRKSLAPRSSITHRTEDGAPVKYATALRTEAPNASVNTFGGVCFLPPIRGGGKSVEIPLGVDNLLLRGAILRNTEWAIGIAIFTGNDTKLVKNSVKTPSKFSKLDQLMNKTVLAVLALMFIMIALISTAANATNKANFDKLWYVGLNKNSSEPWPYLPKGFEPPIWKTTSPNWAQTYMLFITLLSNFVPLSLYFSIEMVVLAMRFLINHDLRMYDAYSDTRAVARSSTVTDLGQVEYIFSDKTGTLTQNVMRFKRCSVDGSVFGDPVVKATEDDSLSKMTSFHPISQLLDGKVSGMTNQGTSSDRPVKTLEFQQTQHQLTFNSEMFLRVMSLCHTVIVEEDLDANEGEIKSPRKTKDSKVDFSAKPSDISNSGKEDKQSDDVEMQKSNAIDHGEETGGAPKGFAYQAESPDESALVEAASLEFGFQVAARDSSGIRLSVSASTIFSDDTVVERIKNGSLTEEALAADTASPEGRLGLGVRTSMGVREEVWEVLAVNKFDSTRKRMSVLVRSPPELGSIPMLLCKGADSAMLDPTVVKDPSHIVGGNEDAKTISARGKAVEDSVENDYDIDSNLSLQSHLGEFAREGLRTLVLGVRILSESECSDWLDEYQEAATSIKNRDELLTAVAMSIERKLHIVGATAIEDKLQVGVPDTIDLLGRAGIKLWVLTGDKRETAKEIGYATKVLTEKMRDGLIEVAQASTDEVRTIMAMAFLKLAKHAKLPEYQTAAVSTDTAKPMERFFFKFGKFWRSLNRARRRFWHRYIKVLFWYITCRRDLPEVDPALLAIDKEEKKEESILQVTERRRNVRNRAEKIVRDYLNTPEGMARRRSRSNISSDDEISVEDMDMPSMIGPDVFDKARSAGAILKKRHKDEKEPSNKLEKLTKEKLAASCGCTRDAEDQLIIDEDVLSMKSVRPSDGEEDKKKFDKRKRTPLEMAFATDKSVRHGRLVKHLSASVLASINENGTSGENTNDLGEGPGTGIDGPRALVIEGAALEHLLGDDELEELLFAVANTCDSVIACRVSPAQKAQLVQLVRRYVVPEPVTLAIGDGANDVGMIQEAQVGVGISGKEGQQAVNASDFAIAQFRFLEELTLIHGRWNFMRMVQVVLFSFYKNWILAGCMIAYCNATLYSGTPFFDVWNVSAFNFVAAAPIIFLGIFDRCLDKDYVKANPEVYTPTRRNELITRRSVIRWIILAVFEIVILYCFSIFAIVKGGGGSTSAFLGLMKNKNPERPGNGEGGDLKSVGIIAFSSLILLLALKVLYESRTIIVGQFPACSCSKKSEGWPSRLAYTWIGTFWLSIGFYVFHIVLYQTFGYAGPSAFSSYVDLVNHAFGTRTRNWMVLVIAPTACMVIDIFGKLFSNMFYPTQTQIHVEIFSRQKKSR